MNATEVYEIKSGREKKKRKEIFRGMGLEYWPKWEEQSILRTMQQNPQNARAKQTLSYY